MLRHLERSGMPEWMVYVFIIIETLSREISSRSGACTIEEGDFSAPLRCARNDGVTGQHLRYSPHFEMTVEWPAAASSRAERRVGMRLKVLYSFETLSREISRRHGACTMEEGDLLAPLPALEMTARRGSTCVIRFILK